MPDIWSYCEPCGRWFYCPAAETPRSTVVCPVCAESPMRRVDRAADRDHQQEPVA